MLSHAKVLLALLHLLEKVRDAAAQHSSGFLCIQPLCFFFTTILHTFNP